MHYKGSHNSDSRRVHHACYVVVQYAASSNILFGREFNNVCWSVTIPPLSLLYQCWTHTERRIPADPTLQTMSLYETLHQGCRLCHKRNQMKFAASPLAQTPALQLRPAVAGLHTKQTP